MMTNKIKKKIIIIGGTSGIGYETGKHLAFQGYDVLLCGRHKPEKTLLKYHYVDITSEDSVKELFLSIDDLDGLIYSAGITIGQKTIEEFNKDIYQKIMDVNVSGLLLALKYAHKLLKANKGKVVAVNSLAGRTYSKFSGLEYTISKSALSGLVRHLSIEFAQDNILINSIFPSMTATPMLLDNVDKSLLKSLEEEIPLGKIADPLEIAKAIEFLISDNNTYMTGSGLDINGGQYLNG